MKAKLIFIERKKNEKPNTKSEKLSFSKSTNIQFTNWVQLLQLKACQSLEKLNYELRGKLRSFK